MPRPNGLLNKHPLSCPTCGTYYGYAETTIHRRNDEWICARCWETSFKVTEVRSADIEHCHTCGGRLFAGNRTVNNQGQVVHGGNGKTCPARREYTARGADDLGRRTRQNRIRSPRRRM